MKTVLVVCPTTRDHREFARTNLSKKYNIIFPEWDKVIFDRLITDKALLTSPIDPHAHVADLVNSCKKNNVDAIVSSDDYPGSILASFIAQECNLIGSSPKSVLTCHHKYYARREQSRWGPESTPHFMLIDTHGDIVLSRDLDYPFFIKPVKSSFSVYARCINNAQELMKYVSYARLPESYLSYLSYGIDQVCCFEFDGSYYLAEDILEGFQVTVEGFVFNGDITILGIVDSIMFPGTMSFARFEYPSQLSLSVQKCMANIAKKAVYGAGLDNTMFNVECIYNRKTGAVHIIEINSRMSSQFADLFEKVDGVNSYEIMVDLALGRKPNVRFRQGYYSVAASCVLRTFEDKYVVAMPSSHQLQKVYELFPDVRIELCVQEQQKLSSSKQDEYSYRYGLINLGASCWSDLREKYQKSLNMLEFIFEPV